MSSPQTDTPAEAVVPETAEPEPADEFLWLEDIYGDAALDWVREQNALTDRKLLSVDYTALEERVLEVLDSVDKIPMVAKRGDYYYNFWRDAEHPRGLWRRTDWESYTSAEPDWEILLDVDELSRTENVDWVFAGASLLRPDRPADPWRRALLILSPDGGDAHEIREFDVEDRGFVPGGFRLAAAKSRACWVNADMLYVGTDFGPGSMTTSSYPRTVRRLHRGDAPPATDAPQESEPPAQESELVFEVPEDHMTAVVARDLTPGFERDIAVDVIDFFRSRTYLRRDGQWVHLDVPDDVNIDLHRQWVVFRPRTDWAPADVTYPAGSLLGIELERFLAGERSLIRLFTPDAATSLQSWSWTRDHLLLNLLHHVSARILTPDPNDPAAPRWANAELADVPALHSVDAYAVDDEDESAGNDYWLVSTGFRTPTTVSRGALASPGATTGSAPSASAPSAAEVKKSPSYFSEADYHVEQHFAVSADGTRVPYFQVGTAALVLDGANPTLLSGYGGFEVSRTPTYSGATGRSWLARRTAPKGDGTEAGGPAQDRGGVYVIANIRGGGEYGPAWHRAARQQNRHRAYEDFAAVAQDLIRRGVTSREHLGCEGRSNGGLLVGNMLTQYPQLFGAISCGVPLLDMRRYTKLSAGYSWIAEYGDPDDPAQWKFVQTFSPYHNLSAGTDYPATFFYTATSDDRVGPAQARKMAARMQAMGIGNVWFYESLEGGHAGAADNRQAARLHTASHEFLWQALAQ